MDPVLVFILVVVIGVAVGIMAQRLARTSWVSRQISGGRRADLTGPLVGIAGAFLGFHLAALLFLAAGMGLILLSAALGGALVVWGWREIRL